MKTSVIILGATPFSSLMRCYLEQSGEYEVIAYTAEKKYVSAPVFDNLPCVAFEELTALYPPENCKILNTIGFVQMNSARERLFHEAKSKGYTLITFIHPSASVNSPVGEGCIILEHTAIGFRCSIGEGCIIWSNVAIPHDCKVGAFSYWSPGAVSCGNVEIGSRCFIGANAVLKNRIVIAEECLIGAGAYLGQSCDKPGSVFAAKKAELSRIPARRIF